MALIAPRARSAARRPVRIGAAVARRALAGRSLPAGLRPPGAVELAAARRRRERAERRTRRLGLAALGTTCAVGLTELARVWRHGSAPLPTETADVVGAAGEAARQTVEVAVEGYRQSSLTETVLLNMLTSFTVAFGLVRVSTHLIRTRGSYGPLRNVSVRGSHVHHFVPGIVLAFLSGGAGIVWREPGADAWLAVPFGVGVAMTLDESALLLKLDDVYWTEEGIVSVQIALGAVAVLSGALLALRVFRRGEERVLEPPAESRGAVVAAPVPPQPPAIPGS